MHMHCKQPLWELGRISKRQAARLVDSVDSGVRASSLCVSHTNFSMEWWEKEVAGREGVWNRAGTPWEVNVKLTSEGFGFPTETVPADV